MENRAAHVIQPDSTTAVPIAGEAAPAASVGSRHMRRRFYRSAAHEEALARLLYLAEYGRAGGLLVGVPGSGKTTVLNEAARDLKLGGRQVIAVDMAYLGEEELVESLFAAFRVRPTATTRAAIYRELASLAAGANLAGRPTVLLLDDVDLAESSALEAIDRVLRCFGADSGTVTVLATASDAVKARACNWIDRTAELRIDLGPLSAEEVAGFLAITSLVDGVTRRYSRDAALVVYDHTTGQPRQIGRLARLAALAAEAAGADEIDAALVQAVANELPSATALAS